eukprot:1150796-Pelagomonas_calceolata.AAC.3
MPHAHGCVSPRGVEAKVQHVNPNFKGPGFPASRKGMASIMILVTLLAFIWFWGTGHICIGAQDMYAKIPFFEKEIGQHCSVQPVMDQQMMRLTGRSLSAGAIDSPSWL